MTRSTPEKPWRFKRPSVGKIILLAVFFLLLIITADSTFRGVKNVIREAVQHSEKSSDDLGLIDSFCPDEAGYVFRRVKWGMPLKEIKAGEAQTNSKLSMEDKKKLIYEIKIHESAATVFYLCSEEKGLDMILVLITFPDLDEKGLEEITNTFKKMFDEKYKRDAPGYKTIEPDKWYTPETNISVNYLKVNGPRLDNGIDVLYIRNK